MQKIHICVGIICLALAGFMSADFPVIPPPLETLHGMPASGCLDFPE
jgi:hypothetical protein